MLLLPPRWGQHHEQQNPAGDADVGALGPQLECQDGLLCQASSARIVSARNADPQAPAQPTAMESVLCMSLGACQARGPGISAGPGHLLPWPQLSPTCGVGDRPWGSPLHSSDEQGLLQGSDRPRIKCSDYEGDCAVPAKLAAPLIVSECPGALEMAVQDGN